MTPSLIKSVLFVCLGNICRSPSAHAVFRQMARTSTHLLEIDSAGTAAFHVGSKPDKRSVKSGNERGYDFAGITSRKVEDEDFEKYDLILAMDNSNLTDLLERCPSAHQHKVKLMMDYAEKFTDDEEVPDPYYGGTAGFEYVLDLIEDASAGLLNQINRQYETS